MPYLITTDAADPRATWVGYPDNARTITSRAVATLDRARTLAARPLKLGEPGHPNHRDAHRHVIEAQNLPEQGGTVGPLPDGTTITVAPMTCGEMLEEIPSDWPPIYAAEDGGFDLLAIVDAYNASREAQ